MDMNDEAKNLISEWHESKNQGWGWSLLPNKVCSHPQTGNTYHHHQHHHHHHHYHHHDHHIMISTITTREITWWSREQNCSRQRQRPPGIFPTPSLHFPQLEISKLIKYIIEKDILHNQIYWNDILFRYIHKIYVSDIFPTAVFILKCRFFLPMIYLAVKTNSVQLKWTYKSNIPLFLWIKSDYILVLCTNLYIVNISNIFNFFMLWNVTWITYHVRFKLLPLVKVEILLKICQIPLT